MQGAVVLRRATPDVHDNLFAVAMDCGMVIARVIIGTRRQNGVWLLGPRQSLIARFRIAHLECLALGVERAGRVPQSPAVAIDEQARVERTALSLPSLILL